eukprot:CAMPEP_0178430822 /NCGR_PEP_ID=MMETSP0689_2-20121128/31520_1 /TAXON_ID=160604 /ORGANISM="Amphidinium massartii, Strain CS-259" /LENGTH=35 /DNA_ID= /DNA_START= /DNA_END= /DNA_ORIENTATION=
MSMATTSDLWSCEQLLRVSTFVGTALAGALYSLEP